MAEDITMTLESMLKFERIARKWGSFVDGYKKKSF